MAEGTQNGAAAPKRHHHKRAHHRPHAKPAIGTGSVKNEINVTPLVDVVLVLLIIFMVVTPMLSRGVAVDLPETKNHTKKNDTGEQVVIAIQADGKIFIEAENVPPENLIEKVRQEQKKHTGELHVKADRRATYGQVRSVLERLHDAGFGSASLASEELKTEGKK
jgi:biopolymer transport protein TolR